jgi:hypothetical protein
MVRHLLTLSPAEAIFSARPPLGNAWRNPHLRALYLSSLGLLYQSCQNLTARSMSASCVRLSPPHNKSPYSYESLREALVYLITPPSRLEKKR